jgi:uncharacterized protein (DUF111 family)
MAKTKMAAVMVEPEFHEQLKRKSEETGVPFSEVARRAWEVWLKTGELPKLPKSPKRSKT